MYLHNELSYAGWSPDRVFFGCLVPATSGGETQLADGREIFARLDRDVRDRFESRGVTYLQHLGDAGDAPGIGKSWQETFETSDRDEVEAYLHEAQMEFEWTDLGLRTAANLTSNATVGPYAVPLRSPSRGRALSSATRPPS